LDRQTGTFRGEFEEMYQDIEDPWGCEIGQSSLNNKIFMEVVFDGDPHFDKILDIGCGLGGLLNAVKVRNGEGYVLGIDVSQTAIRKAKERYPDLNFNCHDILQGELPEEGYDLIILSEVLWYVLKDLPLFFARVSGMMSSAGLLAIHQYFPDDQNFGREQIDGLPGFLTLLEEKVGFIRKHMVTSYCSDGRVLLSTYKKGK
jgi:cyclopropane fatty-acyl-phospholipid synthase-like methyltransferase